MELLCQSFLNIKHKVYYKVLKKLFGLILNLSLFQKSIDINSSINQDFIKCRLAFNVEYFPIS